MASLVPPVPRPMYVKETVADAHGGAGPYFILSNCAATPTTCGRTSSAPLLMSYVSRSCTNRTPSVCSGVRLMFTLFPYPS